ncbi:DUF3267 domain-containing protein [Solibacillus sp. FSL W7-1472]|uniref:DUF3267 domain-containing protein n=2 Tax=Solibacillus TaxID=648800 RepID=F2F016_SOLSS|nr:MULTISPECIES: DUF3267 domain-containing protein [Solibacillus]AMO86862.1 hypothetical protein SOLI23_15185 [Solibacillus silvestris]EKB44918.1 hypothetical protein B857_02287 [Solibacillus isronensis B3W22]OBW56912.1 hypothetical protein A9986_09170 [Solibacillus silvestris]BAK15126.1 hypothetical protein SSIL_0703 [Solibacillus silvestris StLB046]
MHCWKTINIEREYGTGRLVLLAITLFVLVFCFSYIAFSFNFNGKHIDRHLWLVLLVIPFIYPMHKLLHYFALLQHRKSLVIRFKIQHFMPVVRMRLQNGIPKKSYIFALVTPFIVINSALIAGGIYFPEYAHYFSGLLAFHSCICLMDFLYVKNLMYAPNNAIIEETPRGYEILVPIDI